VIVPVKKEPGLVSTVMRLLETSKQPSHGFGNAEGKNSNVKSSRTFFLTVKCLHKKPL
jgi:hypothetical protein